MLLMMGEGGGLARARAVPGTQTSLSAPHSLQSSKSSQYSSWKHPHSSPPREIKGSAPPGLDQTREVFPMYSALLCPSWALWIREGEWAEGV